MIKCLATVVAVAWLALPRSLTVADTLGNVNVQADRIGLGNAPR